MSWPICYCNVNPDNNFVKAAMEITDE